MKVLSGAHSPDSGQMELDARAFAPANPHQARLAGVAMIYQELNLAPDLSVEDNIMLGQEMHRAGWLNRAAQKRRVREGWFLGGSTVVVSSDGVVRYAVAKHLDSKRRLKAQRDYLRTQEPEVRDAAWAEHSVVSARLQRAIHRRR